MAQNPRLAGEIAYADHQPGENDQGHDGVVRAVYNGDCDVWASYVDARGAVEDDLPNVMDEVVVIAVTDDMPNDNVTILGSLPPAIRESIVAGLAAVAETPEGQEAMSTAYGIEALQPADDTFYDAFRVTLDQAGVDVAELAEQ